MPTIFIRTILFYVLIILSMRLTGKRQVGQLELSELVTAFMLSELASIPISNINIPISHGIVPILTLISIEVFISFFCVKFPFLRKLVDGTPSTLIKKGVIDKKALTDCRISVNELLSAMRLSGVSSISEVNYVFLEPSGNISIIPKKTSSPITPKMFNKEICESGVDHSIIIDSYIIEDSLMCCNKDKKWLEKELSKRNLNLKDVFYFAIDDNNNFTIIKNKDLQQ